MCKFRFNIIEVVATIYTNKLSVHKYQLTCIACKTKVAKKNIIYYTSSNLYMYIVATFSIIPKLNLHISYYTCIIFSKYMQVGSNFVRLIM